jgi:pimeloyl-ACP methyl ester carboxylesterase
MVRVGEVKRRKFFPSACHCHKAGLCLPDLNNRERDMHFTNSAGLSLAYDDIGSADLRAVVLVHGFSSNRNEGWKRTGWYAALGRRRERLISIDLRGHGDSAKPHDAAAYDHADMAGDIIELLDHLKVERASIIGFSLGARIALGAALARPDRFDHLVMGGVGARLFDRDRHQGAMAQAMLADEIEAISNPLLKSFRQFADEQGEDRAALAACSEGRSVSYEPDDLFALSVPTMVCAGARDLLAGSAEGLAEAIRGAHAVTLPGCDHFGTITHALFKGKTFDFFDGWLDVDDAPGFQ